MTNMCSCRSLYKRTTEKNDKWQSLKRLEVRNGSYGNDKNEKKDEDNDFIKSKDNDNDQKLW